MKNKIAMYIGPGVNSSTINHWVDLYMNHDVIPYNAELLFFKEKDFTIEKLKEIDCIILPGGSGSKICNGLGTSGKDAIMTAVGWYGKSILGICAGNYALLSGYDWSLGMINYKILDKLELPKGDKDINLYLTDKGNKFFHNNSRFGKLWENVNLSNVHYHNGPIMVQADESFTDDVLATFATPIYESGQHVNQDIGSPAIVKSKFGDGQVIAISPHFEKSGGEQKVIIKIVLEYLLNHEIQKDI